MPKQRLMFLVALTAGVLLVACETVSGVLTPAPTYTNYPTQTPYPTYTLYPTYTPFPDTTAPPPTEEPPPATATPVPTLVPSPPTATPIPTLAPPPATSTFFADQDQDGFGDIANSIVAESQPLGYVTDDTDCDDGNPEINPEAVEVLDGWDNDCDFQIDEDLVPTVFYADNDGDGYGDPATSVVSNSPPAGYVSIDGDCDDTDFTVNPGAKELDDDIDHNCNGVANDL